MDLRPSAAPVFVGSGPELGVESTLFGSVGTAIEPNQAEEPRCSTRANSPSRLARRRVGSLIDFHFSLGMHRFLPHSRDAVQKA